MDKNVLLQWVIKLARKFEQPRQFFKVNFKFVSDYLNFFQLVKQCNKAVHYSNHHLKIVSPLIINAYATYKIII